MQVTTPLPSWFQLKISSRLIQSEDKCRIWAPILVSTLNLFSKARRLAKFRRSKRELKPPVAGYRSISPRSRCYASVNNQWVVYKFQCYMSDADHVRYTLPTSTPRHQWTLILSNKRFSRRRRCFPYYPGVLLLNCYWRMFLLLGQLISRKKSVLTIKKFQFFFCTSKENDNVTAPEYPVFALYYLSSGRSREVKKKFKILTLRVVAVAYKRFQIWWFDLETFGTLLKLVTEGRWSQPEIQLYFKRLIHLLHDASYMMPRVNKIKTNWAISLVFDPWWCSAYFSL